MSEKPSKIISAFQALIAIFICQLAGIIGAVFTTSAIPTWYTTLERPIFNPPNWVFGPVWTLLYTMMGISLYLVWRQRNESKLVQTALSWFAGQLALNSLWSIVFFGQKNLWGAFIVIILLWGLIFKTIRQFWPISRPAAWLLIPYLAWVSFATMLNFAYALLN